MSQYSKVCRAVMFRSVSDCVAAFQVIVLQHFEGVVVQSDMGVATIRRLPKNIGL